jgi:hypothetical protein
MCAGALADGANESIGVSVSGTDGVVTASGETPGEDFAHVKVALLLHPVEDARP